MRPSRILGIALLLLMSASGCAQVQSRMGWSTQPPLGSDAPAPRESLLARWWPRQSSAPAAAPAAEPIVNSPARGIETARKATPETEIWPSPASPRLTRRFSLFGLRERQAAPITTSAAWPVQGRDASARSHRILGDGDLKTASSTRVESQAHERPLGQSEVALGVEPDGFDPADLAAARAASEPVAMTGPSLELGPRPDHPAKPRLETDLLPTSGESVAAADADPAQGEAQKPAAGNPPPPLDEIVPRPVQRPRTTAPRPTSPSTQPGTGTRRPQRPAPPTEGQRTPPATRPARPTTPPPATTAPPVAEPVPAPVPVPAEPAPTPTPAPVQPKPETAPEPQPAPTTPPPAPSATPEPAPAPATAPAPAAAPAPQAQPAASPAGPSGQAPAAVPAAQRSAAPTASPQATGPAAKHAPHQHGPIFSWIHSLKHRGAEPEPKCALPPVTFPTTYKLAMPAPQAVVAAPVQPTAQLARPAVAPAACKTCVSGCHRNIFSAVVNKLKNCDKLAKLKAFFLGCKCHCHDAPCKHCTAKVVDGCGPTASPQANAGHAFAAPAVGSGAAQASDVSQGPQVLERIASEGLDKAPQR